MIEVWTDGACSLKRGGVGGWAWAVQDGMQASGATRATTNQRMEMYAVLKALRALPDDEPLRVVSDSAYVINCFLDAWWVKWQRDGDMWRKRNGDPVANSDLWGPLLAEVAMREAEHGTEGMQWRHVRGHAGHEMNELCDRLAVEAKSELIARLGL